MLHTSASESQLHKSSSAQGLSQLASMSSFSTPNLHHPQQPPNAQSTTMTASSVVQPVLSVNKTLTRLMAVPANRSCADCRSTLVDSSQVYASFSPMPEPAPVRYNNFRFNHASFAPPGHNVGSSNSKRNSNSNVSSSRSSSFCSSDSGGEASISDSAGDEDTQHHHMSGMIHNNSSSSPRVRRPLFQPLLQRPPAMDPSLLAAKHVGGGGHGVFVCALCGAAHKLLGPHVAVVHAVQDTSAWTLAEVQVLAAAGGNAKSWAVLERYMPTTWSEARRPKSNSSIADRLTFIRAKYEALAFVLPPAIGPLADQAWKQIVVRHNEWDSLWDSSAYTLKELELGRTTPSSKGALTGIAENASDVVYPGPQRGPPRRSASSSGSSGGPILPNRLVDYFCVVTASDYLEPSLLTKDLSTLESPEDFCLTPVVQDCFPPQDSYADDTEFPEHVGSFVCPEGCRPQTIPLPPSFFTFVLTGADGSRLYGGALRVYDLDQDTEHLSDVLTKSGYTGKRPSWLPQKDQHSHGAHKKKQQKQQQEKDDKRLLSQSVHSAGESDVIFLPKCIVILSHYPFFDIWRKFLLKIYRIALVEAPLPMERYIANFCAEVPLPPPGKIQVKFGFTVKEMWSIQRPPENQLPMANFSYRPLFAALSVSNVLIVSALLMQETRVALVSKYYSILTPVAEALLSFLFPFHWQGMYLPIMPYSMLDILDAPVPYLVGLHSRYLKDVDPKQRPAGIVFVDLDKDVVHLGYEDSISSSSGRKYLKRVPSLPEKLVMKLKSKLDMFASSVYILPHSAKAGCITTGDGKPVPYANRDPYAHVTSTDLPPNPQHIRRKDVFANTEKAYGEYELQTPISGFLSEHGQFYKQDVIQATPEKKQPKFKLNLRNRLIRQSSGRDTGRDSFDSSESYRSASLDLRGSGDRTGHDINLLNMEEPEGFSSEEIRNAFLRFWVTLFMNYRQYIDNGKAQFRSAEFVASLNGCTGASLHFVEKVLQTQMFDKFIEERVENPSDPEVLFFDESITAKLNRSKKTAFATIGRGGKKDTAFLDDKSKIVRDTFTPPPPSNWGLPADDRTYHYGCFPKLDPELFGKIRRPIEWQHDRRRPSVMISRRFVLKNEQAIMARSNFSTSFNARLALGSMTKTGVKNLEFALNALSSPFVAPMIASRKAFEKSDRLKRSKKSREHSKSSPNETPVELSCRSLGIVSTAEEVVLNARRKQSILLGIIIRFQAYCRMHMVRTKYLRRELVIKEVSAAQESQGLESQSPDIAAIKIQRWIYGIWTRRRYQDHNSAILIQRWYRANAERRRVLREQSARRIQRWIRAVWEMRRIFRCKSATKIQSAVRRMWATKRYMLLRNGFSRLQAVFRSRRTRLIYGLLLQSISEIQSLIRGFLVRRFLSSLFKERMLQYQQQIFELWQRAHTPLCFRTNFWPLLKPAKFINSAVAETELQRLWKELSITVPPFSGPDKKAGLIARAYRLGISCRIHCGCLEVSKMLANNQAVSAKEGKGNSFGKPSRNNNVNADSPQLRVAAERTQVYERLSAPHLVKPERLLDWFVRFNVPLKDKKKKLSLTDALWNFFSLADASAKLMLEVFPELIDSTNIFFMEPSKKAIRRFKSSDRLPSPLERPMWAHTFLEERSRRNIREVASVALCKVPAMAEKIFKIERRRVIGSKRHREAILQVSGRSNWEHCRFQLMLRYMSHTGVFHSPASKERSLPSHGMNGVRPVGKTSTGVAEPLPLSPRPTAVLGKGAAPARLSASPLSPTNNLRTMSLNPFEDDSSSSSEEDSSRHGNAGSQALRNVPVNPFDDDSSSSSAPGSSHFRLKPVHEPEKAPAANDTISRKPMKKEQIQSENRTIKKHYRGERFWAKEGQ